MDRIGFGLGRLKADESSGAIVTALRTGYRFFDTARMYETESTLREALEEVGINRSEVFIGTKVGSRQLGNENIFDEVERSLDALDTEYLDLLYVHWPAHEYHHERTLGAFESLRSKETIGAIGICNVTAELLEEAVERSPGTLDYVQIEFHPYLYQSDILGVADRFDIEVVAESPLAYGRVLADPTVEQFANREDVTKAQLVLAWSISHGTIPIPGSSNDEHIRENFRAKDIDISQETREALDGLETTLRINDYPFAPWNN